MSLRSRTIENSRGCVQVTSDEGTIVRFTNKGPVGVVFSPCDGGVRLCIPDDDIDSFQATLLYVAGAIKSLRQKGWVVNDLGTRWRTIEDAAWSINVDPAVLDEYIMNGMALDGRIYDYV